MKVLMQNSRLNWTKDWGGDSTQILQTANGLRDLGVSVSVSEEPHANLRDYDLVHIFNIQTAATGLEMVMDAKRQGLPVALSTIYWDFHRVEYLMNQEYHQGSSLWPVNLLGKVNWRIPYFLRKVYHLRENHTAHQRACEMVSAADILLPNSYAELEIIVRDFDLPWARAKSCIVPNAVNEHQSAKPTANMMHQLPNEFLLQAATYTPLKKQLSVIKALYSDREIPLVFAGRGLSSEYGRECVRLGEERGNTYFFEHIEQEEMWNLYSRCKVHVLPSLRESPGLATLEAGAYGANCVVSVFGPVTEYFGEDAWYCDPTDNSSIRQAILSAWAAPRAESLRKKILNNFTWGQAAKATLAAYQRIVQHGYAQRAQEQD